MCFTFLLNSKSLVLCSLFDIIRLCCRSISRWDSFAHEKNSTKKSIQHALDFSMCTTSSVSVYQTWWRRRRWQWRTHAIELFHLHMNIRKRRCKSETEKKWNEKSERTREKSRFKSRKHAHILINRSENRFSSSPINAHLTAQLFFLFRFLFFYNFFSFSLSLDFARVERFHLPISYRSNASFLGWNHSSVCSERTSHRQETQKSVRILIISMEGNERTSTNERTDEQCKEWQREKKIQKKKRKKGKHFAFGIFGAKDELFAFQRRKRQGQKTKKNSEQQSNVWKFIFVLRFFFFFGWNKNVRVSASHPTFVACDYFPALSLCHLPSWVLHSTKHAARIRRCFLSCVAFA